MSQQKAYRRFSLGQRLEHWVMVISFTILALTGLPQKFPYYDLSQSLIAALGGIESVRIIHRYAAIVLMAGTIYHGAVLTYSALIKQQWSMLPKWQDAKDLFATMGYNLGILKKHPKLPRYNFEEKMEYWSLIWGTVLMILTGFMLWNPIATAKFLPGQFIPAAKAAHGGEAVLAVLAILVWHFYGVHIKFNPSMFTGKLPRKRMAHDHALELEQLEKGALPPEPPKEIITKRMRIFAPVAVIIAAALIAGLYFFVTFEDTAIATVEELQLPEEKAYQPLDVENIHATIESYSGAESCAVAGCHSAERINSAKNATHSQHIAEKGVNPLLAHLPDTIAAGDTTPNCLICHAREYNPDDMLASAKTVGAAGGSTCMRCHSSQPVEDVHTEAGLACVSCHPSDNHEITAKADCLDCHREHPHTDPILNTHTKLDCRACHVTGNTIQLTVDVSQSARDDVAGWFLPQTDLQFGAAAYGWEKDGKPATIAISDTAKIVPVISGTIRAPQPFNPFEFAESGKVDGSLTETAIRIVPSHGITKDDARTCAGCHGPESDFDFAALGYPPELASQLSLVQPDMESK